MNSMYLLVLSTLLATVTQVSFGLAGLLLVILTFDDERKKRWFEPNNFLRVGLLFLMVVSSGLIAFLGLAPEASLTHLTVFACVFYLVITILWWIVTKMIPPTEPVRWKWLEKIQGIKGDALILAIAWGYALFMPAHLGIVLVLSLFLPTIPVFVYWAQRG